MSKSNHGCHVEFEMCCSLSEHCTPFHHLQPEPIRSLAEDKQMPANLVLVLTVLAATKHWCYETSWGLFLPQITRSCFPYVRHVSQCFLFCVQVLEMPGFSGNHGGAKLNVAELCWQIHGSLSSLCSLQHLHHPLQNKVTFQDEWYLGVLFWGMKLAKVKERKANTIRALIFRQKMSMQRSIGSNKERP